VRARLACVLAIVLGACGSSVARPVATPSASLAHCAPAGARTMAADGRVEVYSLQRSVHVCGDGKDIRLGNATFCIGTARVDRAAVAGDLVAYGVERCGVDTGSASVSVLRVADGKQLRSLASISGSVGPESYQAVDSLVVKRNGSVAWIATVTSIIGRGSRTEVHANRTLLDSGAQIKPRSLKLHGSKLTWIDGAVTRSASLT
jgi:hypothetical protein